MVAGEPEGRRKMEAAAVAGGMVEEEGRKVGKAAGCAGSWGARRVS